MRPRPTTMAGQQLAVVALFLMAGCIWWRSAPFLKEETSNIKTALGLNSRLPAEFAKRDEESSLSWTPEDSPAPVVRGHIRQTPAQIMVAASLPGKP